MLVPPDEVSISAGLRAMLVDGHGRCHGTGYVVDRDSADPMEWRPRACTCLEELKYRRALALGLVPLEFREGELYQSGEDENCEIRNKIDMFTRGLGKRRAGGRGLLLCGENGVGKTFAACHILRIAAQQGHTVAYLTAHDYLVTSRSIALGETDRRTWFSRFCDADFMVIDELGKERTPTADRAVLPYLDGLMRRRRSGFMPTVFCTNLTLSEIVERYGDSFWSAIQDRMKVLVFRPGDLRAKVRP